MLDNDQKHFSETVEISFVDAVSTEGMLAISTPACGTNKCSSSVSVGGQPMATPIGFALDIFHAWHGKHFDPKAIKCPLLLLCGAALS